MKLVNKINNYFVIILLLGFIFASNKTHAQYTNLWMTAGSFQNWYSEIGDEVEEGFVLQQQYGGEWPAIHPNQDCQAARGLWIGCTNFTDASNDNYPYKVVHVGPRVSGAGEFFPVEFKLLSKFNYPQVYVDGSPSQNHPITIDAVDPSIKSDLELITVDNTQIGLTMTRKIYQFSQQDNDNYMIYDYTFTNTGNTGTSAKLNQTLTGVYFYFQYRNACDFEAGQEIGNQSTWGINTMNDARGDGSQNKTLYGDPPDEQFRAQFSYQGHAPWFSKYDNIGGPLWTTAAYVPAGDTVGRLSAIQFYGVVTLHADKSPTDSTDDINEPSTTNYISSDAPFESNNTSFNPATMQTEYTTVMSTGHESPRHVWKVQPDGKFNMDTPNKGDPGLGTTGGYSFGNGYGPYTIAPGQSIHIVMAEGISGISREEATRVGIAYKKGLITNVQKNDSVLTGQDSLFQTFRRAIANYNSGYNLPEAPLPPETFNVTSGGDKISLSWDLFAADPNIDHFNLYRETGQYDSTAHLIASVPATSSTSYSYDDLTPVRGLLYYYYVTAVGKNGLHSSRYYTQSYDYATLKRPAGTNMSQIRVVPNPFNISADQKLGFGAEAANRLYFFNIPGQCTIKIYTEIGELIYTIHHTDGSGDAYWDSVTSSQQIVVSGVYIAVIHNDATGEQSIVKFVIIR